MIGNYVVPTNIIEIGGYTFSSVITLEDGRTINLNDENTERFTMRDLLNGLVPLVAEGINTGLTNEQKIDLILTYLDERVVDRLTQIEFKLNRLAIATIQIKNLSQIVGQILERQTDLAYFEPFFNWINTVITSGYPTDVQPSRTELEEQIIGPEPLAARSASVEVFTDEYVYTPKETS